MKTKILTMKQTCFSHNRSITCNLALNINCIVVKLEHPNQHHDISKLRHIFDRQREKRFIKPEISIKGVYKEAYGGQKGNKTTNQLKPIKQSTLVVTRLPIQQSSKF